MRFVVPSVISHATLTVSPALKGGGSSLSMAASCLASNSAMIVPVLMPLRAARQVWRGAGAGARSAVAVPRTARTRIVALAASGTAWCCFGRPAGTAATSEGGVQLQPGSSLPSCASRAVAEASGVLVRLVQLARKGCKRTPGASAGPLEKPGRTLKLGASTPSVRQYTPGRRRRSWAVQKQ